MTKFAHAIVFAALLAPANAALAQTANPADSSLIDTSLINISLTNYAFTPKAITLKAGTAYHLHFINSGSKEHNFSAPDFFAAAQIAPEDQAKVKKGLVELESGQSVDVTVTPSRAGSFGVECTHFMHEAMGMHGSITVE